jgi:hypothetical protein
MFSKVSKLIVVCGLMIGFLNADIADVKSSTKGIDVHVTSEKSLVTGNNVFFVTLSKNGKMITDAKVKAKFFMPEMPGMPYMGNKSKAKFINGKYKMNINLSMSGTWQYQLRFKTKNGNKYKTKGSVNL